MIICKGILWSKYSIAIILMELYQKQRTFPVITPAILDTAEMNAAIKDILLKQVVALLMQTGSVEYIVMINDTKFLDLQTLASPPNFSIFTQHHEKYSSTAQPQSRYDRIGGNMV